MAHTREQLEIEPYTLSDPPTHLDPEIVEYLYEELRRLQVTVDHLTEAAPQATNKEPDSPRKGTIRWNLSPWNPLGDGSEGYVQYDGTAWIPLGVFATDLRATVFDDYQTSGLMVTKGAAAPNLTSFRNGLYLNAFAGSGPLEEAFFSVHITHGMKALSTPTFHIHWATNAASPTGNVKWNIEWAIAKGYGVDAYPASATVSTVQAVGAQYDHLITDDDDMEVAATGDMEPDAVLLCRIFRDSSDAEDTSPDNAFLVHVDLHYERDKIGTTERNRPFTGY